MVRNSNNARRRRRRPRQNRRRNMRMVRLYHKPPGVSPFPRTTGLSVGGLSTTIIFEIPITAKPEAASSNGWAVLPDFASTISITPDYILQSRGDALNHLRNLYSEYRLDKFNVHWIHRISSISSGQIVVAVVDDQFGTSDTDGFDSIKVAPNSASSPITGRFGRCWVPTEPSDVNFVAPAITLCKVLVATRNVQAAGSFVAAKAITIGSLHCSARLVIRSPMSAAVARDKLLDSLQEEICYPKTDSPSLGLSSLVV